MSVDDMLDGMNGYEENSVYELRKGAGGPDNEHFAGSKNLWLKTTNNYTLILYISILYFSQSEMHLFHF